MEDIQSLSHSKWNCKYHIVFAPKYRRQVIYGKLKAEIGKILRSLCERKGVEVLEAEACADHIHMLVSIPPSMSVPSAVQAFGFERTKEVFHSRVVVRTSGTGHGRPKVVFFA